MKKYKVEELMVPLSEYATVSSCATLSEAILALETAQEEFDQTKYRHRGILVLNDEKRVVGRISQLCILRALDPQYKNIRPDTKVAHLGFSATFLNDLQQQFNLLDGAMEHICQKAANIEVKTFMTSLTEGEYIEKSASLDQAIHLLVMGNHQSLLVKENERVVGVLRLTDVFAAVFHALKECSISGDTT